VSEIGRLKVILPVLIAKLKLGQLSLLQLFFGRIEFIDGFEEGGAVIIATLVDREEYLVFPAV